MVITGTNRVACYNQTIYDDSCVEEDEFFSLTLTVQDGSAVTTYVDMQLSSALFVIVDDDGELRIEGLRRKVGKPIIKCGKLSFKVC